MSSEVLTSGPMQWIPGDIISFVGSVTTIWILIMEIKGRRRSNVEFTTKSLEISSILCLIFGSVLANLCLPLEPAALAVYQISRLHYCFANNQIHSNKGYPKSVFIIAIAVLITLYISWSLCVLFLANYALIHIKCGINQHLVYYYIYSK